ncbi:MAG: hypothetical protein A2015_14970 [Spirochaetes bacterium GWF1_31_7]|nr:MAG: hypothetical protein A2Y30_08795 [Spirochaetes bacterium GWE1_32_154]OHD47123.1 MAG: hypothetical protein A2Y29_05975 [Spirochaetes bacterium GWE2_31_10]OHD48464.1 MAG: hypothetical protein A2015_14970 [Spirochaetes bacterium GWF1_31_7]OHD79809.1 MAG: hypothetical protein A2355_04620 [Spirochaetes bacterium RIFOXYB1_FULL_32_8]
MFTTIDEVLDYIYSFTNLESGLKSSVFNKNYSLDNIQNILEKLGNPQSDNRYIHIAGTKGKGSTTLFITQLLRLAGYTTLSFMSPHLIRTNERILFNGQSILDSELIELTNMIKEKLDYYQLTPTTFELFFIIALFYGNIKKCDYFIMETGLGGRLDCTNVITPVVSVITSIGLEHTEILGDTITKIASEKAGIIKESVPVVLSKQRYNCKNVFKKKAQLSGSSFFYVPDHYSYTIKKYTDKCIHFEYNNDKKIKKDVCLPLFGRHQIDNFLTALESVRLIDNSIDDKLEKMSDISLPGRIEIVDSSKKIICDVSHTVESIAELIFTLKKHFPNQKWHVLIGLAEDKNYKKIVSSIKKISKTMTITSLSSFKPSNPERSYNYLKRTYKNVTLIQDQKEAFDYMLNREENILITGSFYLTGPFMEYYGGK